MKAKGNVLWTVAKPREKCRDLQPRSSLHASACPKQPCMGELWSRSFSGRNISIINHVNSLIFFTVLLDLINKLLQTLLPWAVAECEDSSSWVLPCQIDQRTEQLAELTKISARFTYRSREHVAYSDQKSVFIESQFKTPFNPSSSLSNCSSHYWCFGEICTFSGRKMENLWLVCVNHIPLLVQL